MWSFYGWACRYCCQLVNTICGRIIVEFVVVFVSLKTQYVVVLSLGFSLFSSVCKHNIWSHYDWVWSCSRHMSSYYGSICRCCRQSVNTKCGNNIVGFVVVFSMQTQCVVVLWSLLLSVSKHNMQSFYGLVCRFSRQSENTIFGRIMVEFVVVVVRQ